MSGEGGRLAGFFKARRRARLKQSVTRPDPTRPDPIGSMLGMVFVFMIIAILFAFVSWPIMIIGLVTGIKKHKMDHKIIRIVNSGEWLEWLPGR
jgi:uncharacterized membrane protein YozB (DUF420 family)